MTKKDFIYIIIIAILTICLGCSVRSCSNISEQYDHNVIALTDTVEYYEGRHNALVAEKTLLVGEMKMLKETNEDLHKLIKDMKVKDPQQVVYVETVVEHEKRDTTYIRESVDSIYNFNFDNQWREFSGRINLKQDSLTLLIDKDLYYMDAAIAIKDGKAYISSNNPYTKYTGIQGITIPKQKEKKWGIGPYAGIEYDFAKREWGLSLGVSISYHLFDW